MKVPGGTINRLCGSGLDAVGTAARAIKSGEASLMIAGGVESMSRAPFVMPKAESAFSRNNAVYDTTIGWRFVNKLMKEQYGVDSMPETAENVAVDYKIEREAQDQMALRSQRNAMAAIQAGHFVREICPVTIPQKKGEALVVSQDEHPRDTSLESLAKLKGVVRPDGSVTAGNASGVNDGACALLLANEASVKQFGLTPKARVVGMANAWGGAIALGHPLGASGARLVTTALNRLHTTGGRYALCTMCIGVGQGIALIIEQI
jgi:acetyl-CoA C-acetyltransferase/acetyl-CoA acyltransferase